MRFRTLLLAAVVSSALATPALAHRQWILPSTTTVGSTSQSVTFDAAVSNDLFHPDHVAMDPSVIKVQASDGSQASIENAAKGRYRGTFDVAINKPGTWKIYTERSGISGTFKVNGQEGRVGGRRPNMGPPQGAAPANAPKGPPPAGAPEGAPRPAASGLFVSSVDEIPAGATDIKLVETQSQYAVFVTSGAPSNTVLTPTGKGLEFDPISQPTSLASDEAAQFRFLIDGKPAAGVKVSVVPGSKKYREAEQAQELVTDAKGIITVNWPVAGMYWLSASAEDNKASDKRAAERRMSFGTTLEVVAP